MSAVSSLPHSKLHGYTTENTVFWDSPLGGASHSPLFPSELGWGEDAIVHMGFCQASLTPLQ